MITLLTILVMLILMPFLYFGLGWLEGLIIKATIGQIVLRGLMLIGLNISADNLPLLCATLSLLGGLFFTSSVRKVNN